MQQQRQRIFIWFFVVLLCLLPAWLYSGSQTVSSTLASTIITQVRYYLNESSATFWADAELLVFLNDGTLNIVARTHCLEDTEDVTLVTDTTSYALSDPFIIIKHAIYNSATALKKGSIDDMGRVVGSTSRDALGYPEYWAQWESNIIVYPKPDSDASGNVVTVYVVDRPTAVVAGANVLVPAQYDKALVYYIVGQALKKDGRLALAAAYIAEYMAECDRYRTDFSTQPNVTEPE